MSEPCEGPDCPIEEPIVEETSFGEYVEDGYGQLSNSSTQIWHILLYGLMNTASIGVPAAIVWFFPLITVGLSSLDTAGLIEFAIDFILDPSTLTE